MGNQVQRDSSYPGERRVRFHSGVAQSRDSEERKRNRIKKKTKCQTAGQEGPIVVEEFPECLSDDLEMQSPAHAAGLHQTAPAKSRGETADKDHRMAPFGPWALISLTHVVAGIRPRSIRRRLTRAKAVNEWKIGNCRGAL